MEVVTHNTHGDCINPLSLSFSPNPDIKEECCFWLLSFIHSFIPQTQIAPLETANTSMQDLAVLNIDQIFHFASLTSSYPTSAKTSGGMKCDVLKKVMFQLGNSRG
mmetsp:Transcript_34802/g.84337  ORF Transcript_34802/g.84337 Transcript_34802/m.84337 type:complete len:106 (+) Transcript_34802:434-751(+)